MKTTITEDYEVRLDYQKPDGYWVFSHRERVTVQSMHGVDEKDNHAAAEAVAKQKFPGCRVSCVKYVG